MRARALHRPYTTEILDGRCTRRARVHTSMKYENRSLVSSKSLFSSLFLLYFTLGRV